jgi:precorrin-3B synthase
MAAPCPTSSAPGPVAPPGRRRGTCPSVRHPLVAGDGLLARLRLAGRALTTAQARALAAAAERHGSGVVELTSRANVQVRGVQPAALAALVDDLAAAGLVPARPEDDLQADVVVAPAAGAEGAELVDVRALAGDLRDALTAETLDHRRLHPKAGVVVDGGGEVSARGLAADVALGAVRRPAGDIVYELAVGAGLALEAAPAGGSLVPIVTPRLAAEVAVHLLAATAGPPPTRLRDLVAARGLQDALARVGHLVEWADPAGLARATPAGAPAPLGVVAAGPGLALVGALPPLGRLDAATLHGVADTIDGGPPGPAGRFVVTPRRTVLVTGVPAGRAGALADGLARLGFVLDGADPAAGVVACTGRPGCPSGHADTLADAHRVVTHLRGRTGPAPTVHLSGCAKRCASRGAHDVTLVAEPGGYDVFVPGAPPAGERRLAGGLSLDDALARAGATHGEEGM